MDEELQQSAEQESNAATEQHLDNEASEAGSASPGDDGQGAGDGEPFDPLARLTAAVDSIGTTDPEGQPTEDQQPATAKPGEKPPVEAKATPSTPPAADTAKPDADEAELLEGIKSERGKERIRSILGERKQLKQDLQEIQTLVQSTGMAPQEFAQTLEFGRLVNSGNESDLRVALEMLEGTRAQLYARLGIEAPGVDLLADHADLKDAVNNLEITRDRAIELAKLRRTQQEQQAQTQAVQRNHQEAVQFRQHLQQAAGAMEGFLQSRSHEVDHPARMKVLSDHFRNPENLQNFVRTYAPEQWLPTLQWMYSNITVPRQAPRANEQPLRSRPATLGTRSAAGGDPVQRLASHIDALGI